MKKNTPQKLLQLMVAFIALAIIYYISYLMLKGTSSPRSFKYVILLVFLIAFWSSSRKVFWFIVFPMVVVYALYVPIGLTYGAFSYDFFISGLSTDAQETMEFIHQIPYKNYIYPVIIVVGILLYKYLINKFEIQFYRNKTFILLAVFMMLSTQAPAIYPKQIKANLMRFYYEYKELQSLQENSQWENVVRVNEQFDTYVLIIGESARKDYLHAYGYPIENTDFMSKSVGVLVDGLTSGGTSTVPSLRAMLTQSVDKNWKGDYSLNLIDLVNKSGISTYWLSNQGYFGTHDTPISAIASLSQYKFFSRYGSYNQHNNKDEILLDEFKKVINTDTQKSKFIVLHLYGSHPDACSRIEEEDLLLKDIDSYYSYMNCYISSIAKTDELLHSIYDILEEKRETKEQTYSMVYFADHGLAHREINGRLYFNNNRVSKLHYDVPLFKVSSLDTDRVECRSFKSGLNFTNGIANWLGVHAEQLDPTYNLFDCLDDSNDYGLLDKIRGNTNELDPSINLLNVPKVINSPQEIVKVLENQLTDVAVHRVNIQEKMLELLEMGIKNIEVDIFVEDGQLLVGHEKKTFSGLSLEEYLERINELNPNYNFMWLDLKDLTTENEELIYNTLTALDDKYKLKSRVFIESRYVDALERFTKQGWDTGYYLKYDLSKQDMDYVENVINDLNRTDVSAITFDCVHLNFAEQNFGKKQLLNGKNISLNCWTFKQDHYKDSDFIRLQGIDRLLLSVKTKNNL